MKNIDILLNIYDVSTFFMNSIYRVKCTLEESISDFTDALHCSNTLVKSTSKSLIGPEPDSLNAKWIHPNKITSHQCLNGMYAKSNNLYIESDREVAGDESAQIEHSLSDCMGGYSHASTYNHISGQEYGCPGATPRPCSLISCVLYRRRFVSGNLPVTLYI